jgi:hypothetical protein
VITTSQLRESPQMAAEEPERAEAPRRYGRCSGGRTETVVEEGVRKED